MPGLASPGPAKTRENTFVFLEKYQSLYQKSTKMDMDDLTAEIRFLVNGSPSDLIDIAPIIETYTSGLNTAEQRDVREMVCSVLMSLRKEGEIEFQVREISMLLTTLNGRFTSYSADIRRAIKYEWKQKA